MTGNLNDLEKDLIHLWENYRVEPQYMQMELVQFRKMAKGRKMAPYARKFLRETRKISGKAIVVMTPGKLSLLTDKDGNLLGFK
jgi:hypothetical protein